MNWIGSLVDFISPRLYTVLTLAVMAFIIIYITAYILNLITTEDKEIYTDAYYYSIECNPLEQDKSD